MANTTFNQFGAILGDVANLAAIMAAQLDARYTTLRMSKNTFWFGAVFTEFALAF
jgi:hypothetical protein